MSDLAKRLARARASLEGLSVGDALGEQFFGHPESVRPRIAARQLPPAGWRWTDDTLMACSVVDVLAAHGRIEPPVLAASFADRFDINRGYGFASADLLHRIRLGQATWRDARHLFDGQGSFGNGAAMRAAPLGAFFAGDPERVVAEAEASAHPTHTHREAAAGAVAVAVAAAIHAQGWASGTVDRGRMAPAFLIAVAEHTHEGSRVREGLETAARLPADIQPEAAAQLLGSGREVAAFDTVPFALWCAAGALGSFEETFWRVVSGLGDRDTTAAIACGVVAAGGSEPPADWVAAREPLPDWVGVSSSPTAG